MLRKQHVCSASAFVELHLSAQACRPRMLRSSRELMQAAQAESKLSWFHSDVWTYRGRDGEPKESEKHASQCS